MAGFSNGNSTSVGLELTPVSRNSLGNELTFLGFAIRPALSTYLTLGIPGMPDGYVQPPYGAIA